MTYDMVKWMSKSPSSGDDTNGCVPLYSYPFTLGGPTTILTTFPFDSDRDVYTYLDQVKQYPAVLATMSEHIAGQKQNGAYLQREVAENVRNMIASYEDAQTTSFACPHRTGLKVFQPSASEICEPHLKRLSWITPIR